MMTETVAPADSQATESPRLPRPETDGAALRAIEEATAHVRERALQIRQNPEEHKPRLVLSQHVRGTSLLDRIADVVNKFCGSMYVFIGITTGIVLWLFLGNIVGFDKTPWPLLAILDNFASKDMPGRQRHIQDCVDQILAKVDPKPAAS
ncbi:MAG TPA: hypothetical protein VGD83_10590 [Streptosporangiaceae bacterium]